MEFLYNPDALSPERIKHTFVARQWVLNDLIGILQKQPTGAGVQHVLIVAPRGMGKTTVFLMLGFAVEASALKEEWQVVRFREESYSITDAGEFWMEAIRQLSLTVADRDLEAQRTKLAADCRASGELESAMVALLKDWARAHHTRLLLLVENFDEILSQIHSEEESSRLRNVMMNDGTVMLIASATSFFEEARGYDRPLYNFFKVYNLEGLSQEQTEELLCRRAELDGNRDFREYLKANAGRVRALSHFTGGNPRLVLMLYAVLAGAKLVEVKTGLEKLLDEVTPYFKAKTELLAPQQRKILDQIARESARTSEGQSPTAIAQAIRLTPNQVSSQLQRMAKAGYVRAVNVRGRTAYYTLSEPLFALWYQMRFGREARERMQWLVEFLRAWYGNAELGTETERLAKRLTALLAAGQRQAAQQTAEYGTFLISAMTEAPARVNALDKVAQTLLDAGEGQSALQLINAQLDSEIDYHTRAGLYVLRALVRIGSSHPLTHVMADLEEELRTDLDQFPENDPLRPHFLLLFLLYSVVSGDYNLAFGYWSELTNRPWADELTAAFVDNIVALVHGRHSTFVKNLLTQAADRPQLFPIRRALEYLDTRDRDLIEKLSPEVRGVVEDIIKRLDTKQQGRS